ncbi:MAG: hypothetical protein QG657_3829 [Acidobacteriota bacterium]|nr:hypothetical protein [Acidobacteriota bacterium]
MNNLPQMSEPMELIAPLPLKWEIDPVLESVWECAPTGEVATCKNGR